MNGYGYYPGYQQNANTAQSYNQQMGMGYPNFSQQVPASPQQAGGNMSGMLPEEESYIENILRLNRGELATVYMTFEDNEQQVFRGIIEAAGRDHIILSDPETERRYILLMVYLDYITFEGEINYNYPFNQGLSSYSPR